MALTKHKLKKAMLEKTLEKSERGGGGRRQNPKILPYFNLDFGQKMEILFLPYEDGDLFKHFKKHGPNMGIASVGSVECIYHARGENCPACAKGFSYVVDGKGTPESKKWMAKDYYVAQVVVLDSPIDIDPLDDGNEVRIFHMPWAVVEKIKESLHDGLIEDPTEHPFILKKTKNQGGSASYANSYFNQMPIDDEIYAAFEDAVVELHDLEEEKIQPEPASEDDVADWVEKAEKALDDADNGGSRRRRSSDDEDEKPVRSRRATTSDDEDDEEKEEAPVRRRLGSKKSDEDEGGDEAPAKEESAPSKGSSLRDRLNRSRARG